MHIEKRNTYTVPFVKSVLDEHSTETQEYYKTFNLSVGSLLAVGFKSDNKTNRQIKDFNLIVEFELFLRNFNNYKDIYKYFSNQTDEIKTVFEQSEAYINKGMPDEVQWTIESEERQIEIALMQVKKAFAGCVVKLDRRC